MALAIRTNQPENHVIRTHNPQGDLEEMKRRRAEEYIKTLRRQCRGFLWTEHYGDMHKLSSDGNKFRVFRTTYRQGSSDKIVVKIKDARSDKQLLDFAQEALILREVVHDHPHVVALLGVKIDKLNTLYLEMEHHPRTVWDMLRAQEHPPTPGQIQRICRDTLKALYFCHRNRVLHADVKEKNLLVAEDNRIVLADFDSSRVLPKPPATLHSYLVCPLGSRPIEVCLVHALTFAADIWALGCMIAYMCRVPPPAFCGDTPQKQIDFIHSFAGPIPADIFVDNSGKKLVNPSGPVRPFDEVFARVPEEVRPFLKRLLALNPHRRPKAVVALNDPFFFFDLDDDSMLGH